MSDCLQREVDEYCAWQAYRSCGKDESPGLEVCRAKARRKKGNEGWLNNNEEESPNGRKAQTRITPVTKREKRRGETEERKIKITTENAI